MLRTVERCKVDASRLHLDLTAVRFAGSYEGSALVKKGWAADRSIGRQVKTLQACTPSGVSLYFRPHQGAQSELPAFMEAIEAFAASLPPGLVVVADSGLGYLENLCAVDSSKVAFVVPLRAGTGWAERFSAEVPGGLKALKRLAYCSQRERRLPAGRRTTWRGLLRPYPVTSDDGLVHGFRVAYIHSSEEEASVQEARSGPCKKPKRPSGGSPTASAAATTRPKHRSTPGSPRSFRTSSLGCGGDDGRTGRQADHHLLAQRGGGRGRRGA